MSSIKLSPNASGTGALTIAAPNTNTDVTFNLGTALGNNGASALVSTDNAGNLGLGVTPSAWSRRAFQIEAGGSAAYLAASGGTMVLGTNVRFNSGDFYIGNGNAAYYAVQADGKHVWATAPSGTAGNAISFTQAMTLDASGNLGVGTTSPSARLHVLTGSTYAANFYTTNTGAGTTRIAIGGFTTGASGGGGSAAIGAEHNHSATAQSSLTFYTHDGSNQLERARIDSSGNLLVGTTTTDGRLAVRRSSNGGAIASFGVTGTPFAAFYAGSAGAGAGGNGAETALYINATNGTGRSINAGGTINASGADYAEYMTKAGDFTVAKGDVVGINADGKLTNVLSDAVSFCVKSTDPSYVGGDIWGNEDALGKRPADDATDEEKAAYAEALEAARQKVDRIAFAGQVPVNVMGATPGQYIVPVDDNGAIKGIAKNEADMTLADYMKSVGKVIAIQDDGRAFIIVKVA